ncbi:MAG: DNA topoisomerase III [Clostridiales bacterium]|nr:DNA topoisomerase III [Clostridiales bacterium]
MKLVVAEKPSVGRDIARVLDCRERGEGFVKNDQYVITWAVGHLVSLCEPDEMDENYKKWRMETLPMLPEHIPTKVLPKTKKQFTVIKKWLNDKSIDSVICATDAGREGELIFRLIYEQAGCKKPVERLWISSMTDEAIREGFDTLKPSSEYEGLYRSAKCRSVADWLVGMNASRAFTLRFNVLLSIGRVQTPTLAILVRRYHEIADFKPEEYYTLTCSFGDYQGTWFDEKVKEEKLASRIKTRAAADAVAQRVKGRDGRVESISREEKRELAPQLYDLTSLQRDANSKLGFTADKTLKITQELYEKWKAVTYPRTDSRYLPMDMLPRVKQTLTKLPMEYQEAVKNIPWKDGKLPFSKRVFDNAKVSDHHAIIPTPQTAPVDKLPADARKIYDLIARRTVAAFYPPMVYEAVKIVTQVDMDKFKTTGRIIKDLGWKQVYGGEKADEVLPELAENDLRKVQKTSVKKEATKPPAPHTDASLLAAMENAGRELKDEELREQMKGSGLGTPATRAAIIERLVQVGYAMRKGRAIHATEKGVRLIAIAPDEVASPETTGRWELALHEIAENRRDTVRFMEGIRRLSAFLVEYAKTTDKQGDFPAEEKRYGKGGKRKGTASAKQLADCACPLCGKPVMESARAFGCSAWREGCRFTLWKDGLTRGGGPVLNDKIVQLLLKNKQVAGSTGTLTLTQDTLSFVHKDGSGGASVPIRYEKKNG